MLPKKMINSFLNAFRILGLLVLVFYVIPAFAQDDSLLDLVPTDASQIPTAETMLTNIANQIPNLMRLVTALAYVMGMFFIFSGIIKLKHMGESRTMMSEEHGLAGPLIYIAVGAGLLYLPTTVQVGMSTFWSVPNPYGYVEVQDEWTQFINVIFMIIQFIGTIAFIRGLVILSHVGGRGGGQGFAKGITHIIGGIFCINIYQFMQVIMLTLGFSSS